MNIFTSFFHGGTRNHGNTLRDHSKHLCKLSDHLLSDIGIERSELDPGCTSESINDLVWINLR